MVTQRDFLGQNIWVFENWTKKMSKNENLKKVLEKKIVLSI
jgi:hypothetical protein